MTFELSTPVADVLAKARESGILAGADVSSRVAGGRQLLKLSFSNREQAIAELVAVFADIFGAACSVEPAVLLPVADQDDASTSPRFANVYCRRSDRLLPALR